MPRIQGVCGLCPVQEGSPQGGDFRLVRTEHGTKPARRGRLTLAGLGPWQHPGSQARPVPPLCPAQRFR